ncbi:MAG: hypothetical protein AAGE80_05135 [Pseudomonadota bacterium]
MADAQPGGGKGSEASWLAKVFDARNIGVFFFGASIFAIEFTELWAVKVPRTVALSNFDILSNSILNIPLLLVAVLVSLLALALIAALLSVLAVLVQGGLAGGTVAVAYLAGLAVSREKPLPEGTARHRLVVWMKARTRAFWHALMDLARRGFSALGHRQPPGSVNHLLQIGVTVAVFLSIWAIGFLSANHYRERIYNFELAEESTCGSYVPPKAAPDDVFGPKTQAVLRYLFEVLQPTDVGYISLDPRFAQESGLAERLLPEDALASGSSRMQSCVTYVGDYGKWAFIVPRHDAEQKDGFLIQRDKIQEFTRVAPGDSADDGNPVFPLAALDVETGDARAFVRTMVEAQREIQANQNRIAEDLAALTAAIRRLEAASNERRGAIDERLRRISLAQDEAEESIEELSARVAELADRPGTGSSTDLSALSARIDGLAADIEALLGRTPGVSDGDTGALLAALAALSTRLEALERRPGVVIVEGGSGTQAPQGGQSDSAGEPDDGFPTRAAGAVDSVRRIGGALAECYREEPAIGLVSFGRNQVAVPEGSQIDTLMANLTEALDLEARASGDQTARAVIFVRGRADSLGTPEVNRRISEQRAAAVQKALERGLGPDLLAKGVEIVSFGIGESITSFKDGQPIGPRTVDVVLCIA